MIRRLLPLALILLLLVPLVSFSAAQASNSPTVSLTSQYIVNQFGFVIVNETVAFVNNGTSTVQIPPVQLGVPDSVASKAAGWVIVSQQPFSQTSTDSRNVTTFTITPGSGSLAAGASVSVSLESYLANVFNITGPSSKGIPAPFLLSPSLNQKVATLDSEIRLPTGSSIAPVPSGFSLEPASISEIYVNNSRNATPSIKTSTTGFADSNPATWMPVQVFSVVDTIIPSGSATPQVETRVAFRNLANYSISSIQLTFLAKGITEVTALPTSVPPVLNPTVVNVTNGALNLAIPPFSAPVQAGDNFTFAIEYPLPSSDFSVSGTTVSVSIPYVLPIQAVLQNYTVRVAPTAGITPVGDEEVNVAGATPLSMGTVDLKYSVNLAWGASQAIPVATVLFAAAFIAIGLRGRTKAAAEEEEEEEGEELGDRLSEMIKAIEEEKIGLFQQFERDTEAKAQGTLSRAEFTKVRNQIDSLRGKAVGRLNAMRQVAGSQRYVDLLNQLQEASREEDRAAKDLLNLFDQYQSRRMKEETYKRLLPNYKKRFDSAVNHLSDLLNLAQREGKQA